MSDSPPRDLCILEAISDSIVLADLDRDCDYCVYETGDRFAVEDRRLAEALVETGDAKWVWKPKDSDL